MKNTKSRGGISCLKWSYLSGREGCYGLVVVVVELLLVPAGLTVVVVSVFFSAAGASLTIVVLVSTFFSAAGVTTVVEPPEGTWTSQEARPRTMAVRERKVFM